MQFSAQGKPAVGIVFDTDMGNSIDDALALALLYGLDGKNELRVVSVSVSKPNLKAAAYCDAVGRFYAGAVSAAFGAFGRTLPVGLATSGKLPEDTPMLVEPLSKRNPDGTPTYSHGIEKLTDTADPAALIRNALTAQHDQNCIAVLAGPATNVARLLELPGVKNLIALKVRFLSMAAGDFSGAEPDFNITADLAAAKRVLADWPTPVVLSGKEMGDALLFPGASIEKDFGWSTAHPIVDAYRAYKPFPYDAPSRDMTAVLYAARPQEGYFKLSSPGMVTVNDDGRTRFAASPQGRHRHLIVDPSQKDRILKTYVELVSAKPVPRQRFRFQQQQQVQPPKPPVTNKPNPNR